MMKNKKLKLIIILVLVIQIILPAGMLGYHYSVYNYALEHTPDFKFYLSYFDLYSYGDNDEIIYDDEDRNDVLYFDIAYRYYREDMFVTVDENEAKAEVKHVLTNMSDRTQTGAIWGLNVTDKGGAAYVKQATEDTGLLSNRNLILWPYNVMTDARFYMDDEFMKDITDVIKRRGWAK